MSINTGYLLIDYLDNRLQGEDLRQAEQLIQHDSGAAQEWQYLQFSAELIREVGLYEQVAAVRKNFLANKTAQKPARGLVRSLYPNLLRVAALVLLFAGLTAVYKYSTISAAGVFNKYYNAYDLNAMRGGSETDPMERAYRNKNWTEVTTLFASVKDKNNKSWFLEAMAGLELKHYENAIEGFNRVIAANARSGDNYFQDEAEYYLAMSYLGANEPGKALALLNKIKADKSHLFYGKVNEMSYWDLKVLELKGGK
jgi:hypothetical protein